MGNGTQVRRHQRERDGEGGRVHSPGVMQEPALRQVGRQPWFESQELRTFESFDRYAASSGGLGLRPGGGALVVVVARHNEEADRFGVQPYR